MLELTYGVNPHQVVTVRDGGIAGLHEVRGKKVSFNALQDILLAGSIIDRQQGPCAAYVKHRLPVLAAVGASRRMVIDDLCATIQRSTGVEFGSLVLNFELDLEAFRVLEEVRFHTIAAPSFSEAAMSALYSDAFQARNRGVIGVTYSSMPAIDRVTFSGRGIGIAVDEPSATVDGGDLPTDAVHNERWQRPPHLDLGLRTLVCARTISVVILEGGVTALVRCGHFDGVSALRHALGEAALMGIDMPRATVLTDGCFGVRQPTEVLVEAGVGRFVFSGGKGNDLTFLAELNDAGIGALCTKRRYFSY